MILDNEFLNNLRRSFNLNLYEVKLWAALLSRGVSTAGELSDIAEVPRSRTYDVLESLEKKGFVMVKPEKPIKYMAIAPKEVIDRIQKRSREKTEKYIKHLDDVRTSDILSELDTLYKEGIEPMQPTDFSGTLRGRYNLYDHISLLIKEAEKTVTIVTTQTGFLRKIKSFLPELKKARERNVKIRIAAPIKGNAEAEDLAGKIKEIAEIRHFEQCKARFVIVDGEQVLFMLVDDETTHQNYDMGIWVNTPFYANAMETMFDVVWKSLSNV